MSRRSPIPRGQQSLTGLYDGLRQEYKASKTTRFQRTVTGIQPLGGNADYHYRTERQFFYAIERARDLERNDTVLSQGLRRLVGNIVQDGFVLDCDTGDEALDEDLQVMWKEWGEDREQVTVTQELTWKQVERLSLYQMLTDGDICLLPTIHGSIESIEAHRLRSPRTTKNVVHGVLLDQNRKRLQYWFTKDDVNPMSASSSLKVNGMRQIPTRDPKTGHRQVWHIYNPKRYSQTRGVTAYQPVLDTIGMLDDVQFARLVQQQAVSAWCILREREKEFKSTRNQAGSNDNFSLPDTLDGTLEGIAAGMEVASNPGEKITGFSPNVPNPQFFDHTNLLLNLIAVNLDQPLAMFMLDPSQTNFSGWRGAMDIAKVAWRQWQHWYASVLHREAFLWKLRKWIAGDQMLISASKKSGIDIYRHSWNLPRWPYIEPLKDTSADLMADRNSLTSKRRLHAKHGVEWSELANEIVADNALAIRKAKAEAAAINEEYQDNPVHWREVLSLPTPDGLQVSITEGLGDGSNGKQNVGGGNRDAG